jgi:hypothetical protein
VQQYWRLTLPEKTAYSITSSARATVAPGNGEVERLGCFEIDDQFEFRRFLDPQIGWFIKAAL